MRAGVAQGGIFSPVLFNLHVDRPLPSRHVELALYAGQHGSHSHVPSASAARHQCLEELRNALR